MKNTFKLSGTHSRLLCAIALLAIIAFSMAACGGSNDSVSIQGTSWKSITTNKNGVVVTTTLTFVDASAFKIVITAPGNQAQTLTGTYTFSGHSGNLKFSSGESEPFTVNGNKLTLEGDTYTKQ
jgi:hypothetical protein